MISAPAQSARSIIDGPPGEVWTNDTQRVRYQFHATLHNTCAVCLQYHGKIGPPWPIPIHFSCRCTQKAIKPGEQAPEPFVNYRTLLDEMPHDQQVAAIGWSNYRLLEAGVVEWEDIVTPSRVRPLREVVAIKRLSVKRMVDAGVRPQIAEAAHEAVHTPEHELVEQHRRELIGRLSKAGLSAEVLRHELASRLAARVAIAPGEGFEGQERLPGAGGLQAERLAKLLAAATITRVALKPKPRKTAEEKRAEAERLKAEREARIRAMAGPSPYTLDTLGTLNPADVAEMHAVIGRLPAPVLEMLQRSGITFIFAEDMASFDPAMAARQPSGWPAGMTYRNADGAYFDVRKVVVATRWYRSYPDDRQVPSYRRTGVMRHETGHAFDQALGYASRLPDFRAAYAADVAAIGDADRERLAYFLQSEYRGPEEVFAEAFAQIHGGGGFHRDEMRRHFPQCVGMIEDWSQRGAL